MQKKERRLAYIVKDTKTYMNAEEARYKYSGTDDDNILFIVIPKYMNNNLSQRMRETLKEELWDEVVWIYTWSNCVTENEKNSSNKNRYSRFFNEVKEFFYNYLDRRKLDEIATGYTPCELVFSAHKNTQEHLAAKLNPEKLFLVDSGHRIFKRINKNGFIDYSRWFISRSRFTRYLFWFTGFKVFDRNRTSLFTVYADEIVTKHKVEKNNFEYQNYLLSTRQIGSEVVWISTPIYAMVEGVKIDDYILYIKSYLNHLNISPDKLIYVPHPGKQTRNEIEYIQNELKCRVDDRDIPVEFKISNYLKLPRACISPFSSALVNIDVASGGRIATLSAWHFEYNFFELWLNWKKDVEKNPELHIQFIELSECRPLFYIDDIRTERPLYSNFKDWQIKSYAKKR